MNDATPMDRLDETIREFAASVGDGAGTVAGWVLAWQEQRLIDEPGIDPVQWRGGYSVSPGMSPYAAVGLAAYLTEAAAMAGADDDGDGDG